MSGQNTVSVCNISLLAISSQSQISNLNEGSTQANACATLFTFVFQMLARTAYWNCLRQQVTLTLLAAAEGTPENPQGTTLPLPPNPWLYTYALPSDCLAARFLVPTWPSSGNNPISPAFRPAPTWIPGGAEQIPFKVGYGTDTSGNPLQIILTNQSQAQLVYTVNQPNPAIWDSDFTSAMVASLAVWLAKALSFNVPQISGLKSEAMELINNARVRDANEGSTVQDHIPDWISARNSGGGYGRNGFRGCGFEFGQMSWPG